MTSNILIFGAKGQLGSDLASDLKGCGHQVVEIGHEVDITDARSLEDAIASELPTAVVNCAAYNNVEDAEEDPLSSYHVNAIGPYHLARITRARGIPLLHVSTDYVFDGESERGYTEDDVVRPLNVYGASKEAGERLVRIGNPQHWIVRTSALYGARSGGGKGYNFVSKMLALGKAQGKVRVVSDQWTVPTSTTELSAGLRRMIEEAVPFGTYHLVSEGKATWAEYAEAIFSLAPQNVTVEKIATKDSGTKIARPRFSVLRNEKLRAHGIVLSDWREALKTFLKTIN